MKKYRLLKGLPTFKAGEIFKLKGGNLYYYPAENGTENAHWSDRIMAYNHKTLEKFPNILDEWFEEVEEPKDYWVIDIRDGAGYKPYLEEPSEMDFEIGNYFETKEEAELAVRKLKAWKRLKDNGLKLESAEDFMRSPLDEIHFEYDVEHQKNVYQDICIILGGE